MTHPLPTQSVTTCSCDLHEEVVNLQRALVNSRTIGVAVGIVMSQRHMTREHAFEFLRGASQRTNRKLADLAIEIVDYGDILDLAPQAGHSYGQAAR